MPVSVQHNRKSTLHSTENTLVLSALKGDLDAFNRLASLYHGPIYRMVYYRIRSKMDTEDITQEVFLSAYQRLHSLRDTQLFKSWLYRIALNKVRDFARKKKILAIFRFGENSDTRALDPGGMHAAAEAQTALERKAFWNKVEVVMGKMSRMEREVFTLRFFDQMGIAQIGHTLKKGESTIKTHLYRAIRKFRKHPVSKGLMEEMIP